MQEHNIGRTNCYNAHWDAFGDDDEERGTGGTKVKAERQEQVEPPKAVAAEESRKETSKQ